MTSNSKWANAWQTPGCLVNCLLTRKNGLLKKHRVFQLGQTPSTAHWMLAPTSKPQVHCPTLRLLVGVKPGHSGYIRTPCTTAHRWQSKMISMDTKPSDLPPTVIPPKRSPDPFKSHYLLDQQNSVGLCFRTSCAKPHVTSNHLKSHHIAASRLASCCIAQSPSPRRKVGEGVVGRGRMWGWLGWVGLFRL